MNYLAESYLPYLIYLKEGGERIRLPYVPHVHKDGYVSPSRLPFCPLKPVLEKENAEQIVPEAADGPAHLHRMMMGTNTGELIQEAFVWKYPLAGGNLPIANTEVIKEMVARDTADELDVSDETVQWKMRGKADAILLHWDSVEVFEIKNIAEAGQGRGKWYSIPQPGAIIQTLAYGLLFNTDLLHIITVSRNDVKLFDFFPVRNGFAVHQTWSLEFGPGDRSVENTEVIAWDNPLNTSNWVNYDTVEALIEEHWAYMNGKRDIPYPDFLNDERGWQCAQKVSYPPKDDYEKRGRFKPRCPFFCHPEPSSNEFVRTEEGQWLRLQEAF